MTQARPQEWAKGVKLLSLLLALLLWLGVALERPGEVKLKAAVHPEYLPAGLRLAAPLPEKLEVTVSGPRILLLRLQLSEVGCALDLTGAAAGSASFVPREGDFRLGRELKVEHVFPPFVQLTLVKETRR